MQSDDLYAILGVSPSASREEIKAAFRRLAKLYHPDKNPDNKDAGEKFRQIKEAYETLINPARKQKYDSRQKYTSAYKARTTTTAAGKKTKTYTTTEEDIRRRKYYQQHYTRQQKPKTGPVTPKPAQYNETRYILFTIPVAVALLFLIINLYSDEKPEGVTSRIPAKEVFSNETSVVKKEKTSVSTSDSPYDYWFGKPKVDRRSESIINVYNRSGYDAVVCLTDKETGITVRNYFIADDYYLLFEFLPEGKYYFKSYLGTGFNTEKKTLNDSLTGAFEKPVQYMKQEKEKIAITLEQADTFSVYIKSTPEKDRISEEEFFRRSNGEKPAK